jgi:hypothetical protein
MSVQSLGEEDAIGTAGHVALIRRIRLKGSQFRRNRANLRSGETNRGWLCKTSIPGSNPGGASSLRS